MSRERPNRLSPTARRLREPARPPPVISLPSEVVENAARHGHRGTFEPCGRVPEASGTSDDHPHPSCSCCAAY